MTAAHIAAMYFNGSGEAAKKRLQKMKGAGLVGEKRPRVNERALLFLTTKGFKALTNAGAVSSEFLSPSSFLKRMPVGQYTLQHELEVQDVKSAFHVAASRHTNITIEEFKTWPLLYEFTACRAADGKEVTVKPDGFIRVHEKLSNGQMAEHSFFLEVDRSSEMQDYLVNRASCYVNYYRSGGFAVWNGATPAEAKLYNFRVLVTFRNEERRNNTAARLLQHNPPILTQTYLTTIDEALSNPFGPIWMCPVDYRKTTAGTVFDPYRVEQGWMYRRQSVRERLVADRVTKRRLLED